MKKLIATACALAAVSFTVPAAAQSNALGDILQSIIGGSSARGSNFDRRIQVAYQRGELSQREVQDLQNRYYQLRVLEQRYRQNGLSGAERADLNRRASDLQRRFEWARSNGNSGDRRWTDNNNAYRTYDTSRNDRYGDGYRNRDESDYRGGYQDSNRYVWQQDRYGRNVLVDRNTGQVVQQR